MRVRATLAVLAALVTVSTAAQAQRGTRTSSTSSASSSGSNPLEIGFDGQLGIGLDDQGTSVDLPGQKIRVGFLMSPAITLEPSLGYVRIPMGPDASSSGLGVDVSMLYHLSTDRTQKQFYLRPVLGVTRVASKVTVNGTTTSSSATFTNFGAAGGIKIPLMNRIATRVEAEFRNQMEKDATPSMSWLNLNFGLSFFTR